MKWQKKATGFFLAGACVLAPFFAFAQITPQSTGLSQAAQGTGLTDACANDPQTCIPRLVANILKIVLGFVEVLLFVYLLYGGFLWMTSGENEKGTIAAKTMIKNATIGLVIIAVSYVAADYVISSLAKVIA